VGLTNVVPFLLEDANGIFKNKDWQPYAVEMVYYYRSKPLRRY
jgi:hypothetical protein